MNKSKLIILSLLLMSVCFIKTVNAEIVDPYNSYLSFETNKCNANGQAKVKAWIYLFNSTGGALPNHSFSLSCDNSDVYVWTPGTTDSTGVGYGYVWTNKTTSVNVWAESDGLTIKENKVYNGGFEYGTTSASSWTVYSAAIGAYNLYSSTGYNNSGKSAGFLMTNSADFIRYNQDVMVSTEIVNYEFSCMVFSTDIYKSAVDGGAEANLDFYANGVLQVSSGTNLIAGNVHWVPAMLPNITLSSPMDKITINLEIWHATGTVRFDAVRITPIPTVKFTTDLMTPAKVADLKGVAGPINGSISLSWTEPGTDANKWLNSSGYYVVKWFNAGDWPLDTSDPNAPVHTYDTSKWVPLDPGTKHTETLTGFGFGKNICFLFDVYDKAGNKADSNISGNSFSVKSKENAIPVEGVKCTTELSGNVTSAYPELNGNAPPGAVVWLQLDSNMGYNVVVASVTAGWDGKWKYKFTKRLGEGNHSLMVYAEDGNGDTSATVSYTFVINSVPTTTEVPQNYPNPVIFSKHGLTTIPVKLSNAGKMIIDIYTCEGVKVKNIVNLSNADPGYYTYTWDGKDDNGTPVESGTYIIGYQLGNETIGKGFTPMSVIK